MRTLFLQALDVWLFRDGRPFNAQGDRRAESLFPPPPSVIQGALRTHYLFHKGVDVRDKSAIRALVGDATDYRDLRLRGPFIAIQDKRTQKVERLFPLPANALVTEGGCQLLWPQNPPSTVVFSAPFPRLLWRDGLTGKPDAEPRWVREADWETLWDRGMVSTVPARALFERENRLGIGMDMNRRTTKEGLLYEAEFIRPYSYTERAIDSSKDSLQHAQVGLAVEMEGYSDWPERGVLQIGGERHSATYETVQMTAWPKPSDPLWPKFAVYLATPAYFKQGWQADWSNFFDGPVMLECAAFGHYLSLGGYDLSQDPKDARAHKPTRRYVPAGAVYFFSAPSRVRFIREAFTEAGEEIGFGQVMIKEWKE